MVGILELGHDDSEVVNLVGMGFSHIPNCQTSGYFLVIRFDWAAPTALAEDVEARVSEIRRGALADSEKCPEK